MGVLAPVSLVMPNYVQVPLCGSYAMAPSSQRVRVRSLWNLVEINSTVGEPKLIAQFPGDDDHACAFSFEWKTPVRDRFIR